MCNVTLNIMLVPVVHGCCAYMCASTMDIYNMFGDYSSDTCSYTCIGWLHYTLLLFMYDKRVVRSDASYG